MYPTLREFVNYSRNRTEEQLGGRFIWIDAETCSGKNCTDLGWSPSRERTEEQEGDITESSPPIQYKCKMKRRT